MPNELPINIEAPFRIFASRIVGLKQTTCSVLNVLLMPSGGLGVRFRIGIRYWLSKAFGLRRYPVERDFPLGYEDHRVLQTLTLLDRVYTTVVRLYYEMHVLWEVQSELAQGTRFGYSLVDEMKQTGSSPEPSVPRTLHRVSSRQLKRPKVFRTR